MTYQLTALFIVIILYFFSASFQTRWINFKLNIAAETIDNIDDYLALIGHDRAERRRFKFGWMKDARLRKEFAKRIVM